MAIAKVLDLVVPVAFTMTRMTSIPAALVAALTNAITTTPMMTEPSPRPVKVMRRRTFISISAAGLGLAQVPGLWRLRQGSAAAATAPLDLASLAQLQKAGSLLLKNTALGPVLLISKPAPALVRAVDPRCPHKGCLVDWQSSEQLFVCPCHDAEFNASGQLSNGRRARGPLTTYKATVLNGRVLVSPA